MIPSLESSDSGISNGSIRKNETFHRTRPQRPTCPKAKFNLGHVGHKGRIPPRQFYSSSLMNESRLDITRLEKIRHVGTKIIARCPACHAAGADKKGDHFFLNTLTGKFGCTVNDGDAGREHRREIF